MRRSRSWGAAAGAAVVALVGVGLGVTPAEAATGHFSVRSATLDDDCVDVGYQFEYSSDAGAVDWDVEATVYDPRGNVSTGTRDVGSGSDAAGAGSFLVCGYEGAGRYNVSVDVTFYDSSATTYDTMSDATSFVMRPQPTRTALTLSDARPRFNQVVRVRVSSRELNPVGWRPNDYENVALDASCRGSRWARVKQSKRLTNDRGVVVLRYRWNIRVGCRLRAVTLPTSNSAQSVSAAKRIKVGARATAVTYAGERQAPPFA